MNEPAEYGCWYVDQKSSERAAMLVNGKRGQRGALIATLLLSMALLLAATVSHTSGPGGLVATSFSLSESLQ